MGGGRSGDGSRFVWKLVIGLSSSPTPSRDTGPQCPLYPFLNCKSLQQSPTVGTQPSTLVELSDLSHTHTLARTYTLVALAL